MVSPYKFTKEIDAVLRGSLPPDSGLGRSGHDENWSDDLSNMPLDARFVATRGEPRSLERLREARGLEAIATWSTSEPLVRQLPNVARLRALWLRDIKTSDLAPVGLCRALEHLVILFAPRLVDLSFLGSLPALRTLNIMQAKRVDLETFPELPGLTKLTWIGSFSSAHVVPSLAPLSRLRSLMELNLAKLRAADGSLRPLSTLTNLKDLALPNYFAVEEFAKLSASLPHIRAGCLNPVFPLDSPTFRCAKCRALKVMLVGKPGRIVCQKCDARVV